ncbi:MAG TPA: hypothetical protein VH986_10330 [Acidimicrobiia bacterium]
MTAIAWLRTRQGPSLGTVVGVGLVVFYLLALAVAMGHSSFDVWGGLVVIPVLAVLTVPFALSAARADGDAWIARIVMSAFLLKTLGAVVRYYVTFSIYGSADADQYHSAGRHLASLFRQGDFNFDIGKKIAGTGFIEIVTGFVYTVTGATKLGGFFVFSWLGFIGLYLFYRAFRIAFPEGERKRYALLVFFLPSLLFWPSSIGKESWMMFTLGIASYGAARLLAARPLGVLLFALGLLGTAMVRPHVSLIAIVAVFGAYLLRKPKRESLLGLPLKIAMLVILALGTLAVMSQMETFFGVSKLDTETTNQILSKATEQSTQGGSAVQVSTPNSPVGVAQAVVAVIFRPWPYEAHNAQALLASLEGVFLLALFLTSLRRIAAVPRTMLRRPYVAFAVLFSLLFAYAFSAIGNFGILSRERVQLYPLLMVLLCVPVDFAARADVTETERDTVETGTRREVTVGSQREPVY